MQFGNSHFLLLIGLLPLLFFLVSWLQHKRQQQQSTFADTSLLAHLQTNFQQSQKRRHYRAWLSTLVALAAVIAILRPQWGFTWKESSKSGVDIVVAVDVSQSMLAEDIKPNRLVRARREVIDLIEEIKGDRIGLVAFAGVAFTETPLTLDYGAFRNFVSSLEPSLLPIKGSNIEAAILESIRTLQKGQESASASRRAQAIILITDGESFDGDVVAAGKRAADFGIQIYIVGIGSLQGAPIPSASGYKKDKNGKVIISRLQPTVLEQLAKDTNGVYVQSISSDEDTLAIYEMGIRKQLEAKTLKWGRAKRWNEHYQIPLLGAVLLLLFGPWGQLWSLSRRKNQDATPLERSSKIANLGAILFYICFYSVSQLALPQLASAQTAEALGAKAREAFEQGDFKTALDQFSKAVLQDESDYRFRVGQAASHYRLREFEKAKTGFFESAALAQDPASKAQALYNAGNSMVQLKEFEDAIKTYEASLALVPEDQETQENLAYAKRMLEQQKQQENQDNDDKENKDSKKQQEKEKKKKDKKKDSKKQSQKQKEKENAEEKEKENKESGDPDKEDQEKEDPQLSDQENQEQQSNDPQDSDRQSQDQQREKDSDDEKEKQQSEQEDSEQKENESEEEVESQAEESAEKEKEATARKPDTGKEKQPQLDPASQMQLESVEEKRNARFNYRFRKAMNQLKLDKQKPPEKDW